GVNETLRKYMPNGTTGSFRLGGCQSVAELEHLAEIGGKTPNGEDARKVLARRNDNEARFAITAPSTPEAQQWSGWGTALKPANEHIVKARKPFKLTLAAKLLEHGNGALNIDASRIGTTEDIGSRPAPTKAEGWGMGGDGKHGWTPSTSGRWPANVILDEHMAGVLDEQSGVSKSPAPYVQQSKSVGIYGAEKHHDRPSTHHGDSGGASRFFYVAKAPKRERPEVNGVKHTTVKPLTLM